MTAQTIISQATGLASCGHADVRSSALHRDTAVLQEALRLAETWGKKTVAREISRELRRRKRQELDHD